MDDPMSGRLGHLRASIQERLAAGPLEEHDSLRAAIAASSKSFFHHGERMGLQRVRIRRGERQRDDDAGLVCQGLSFVACDLSGCIFNGVEFTHCIFDWCSLDQAAFAGGTRLRSTLFKRSTLDRALLPATFDDCIIELCPTRLTSFSRARLTGCRLERLDLSSATFGRAIFAGVDLRHAAGLGRLVGDNTPACLRPQDDAIENPELPMVDRLLAWDRLRAIGRLPVFSVSSATLVLSSIHLYGIATWNDAADRVNRRLATGAERSEALVRRLDASLPPDLPLRDAAMTVSLQMAEAFRHLAEALPKLPLPTHAFWLFLGTVLLALGSALHLLSCPPRIQRFSDVEWRDEIRGSPFHYAPLACTRRFHRVTVAALLALGGLLTLSVAASKLWTTGRFILEHGGAPWPFR